MTSTEQVEANTVVFQGEDQLTHGPAWIKEVEHVCRHVIVLDHSLDIGVLRALLGSFSGELWLRGVGVVKQSFEGSRGPVTPCVAKCNL